MRWIKTTYKYIWLHLYLYTCTYPNVCVSGCFGVCKREVTVGVSICDDLRQRNTS